MNDFEFETIQKKQLVNASRSRVSVGGQTMTEKQMRGLNGKIQSFGLSKPMTWEQFKAMSNDIQIEYLMNLNKAFNVNVTGLAKMFGITGQALRNYFAKYNIRFMDVSGRLHRMSRAEQEIWDEFINAAEKEIIETTNIKSVAPEVVRVKPTVMTQFMITFKGVLDVSAIANSLLNILGDGSEGQIVIDCQLS